MLRTLPPIDLRAVNNRAGQQVNAYLYCPKRCQRFAAEESLLRRAVCTYDMARLGHFWRR